MRRWLILMIVPFLLLSACERTGGTDLVLFCKAYNQTGTSKIAESDVMQRSENEYILVTDEVMLRLKTENAAIHTVVVTADRKNSKSFYSVAQRAFAVLADEAKEDVPQFSFETANGQIETEHFIYRYYLTEQSLTLLQLSSPPGVSVDQLLKPR